ncbi:MAG: DNA polymerase III subunit gamma/tau [Lentisphaeria bacterium]
MSYQVLARKCRPQRFSEIVGQEHITRTLQNAIVRERVGHAYLFVGPRGTGKTTTARIFAKALNCEKGIVKEPCCECRSCREIAAGNSLDIMEIDGASHNKVEHVRDLRDNVQYTPNHSRYKIYIIDEVHMLTTQAWNALLKTLEEPPPHVKFFFATTEPHKVLPTIMSRCQRFDLKRLPVPLIANRLKEIADSENIQIEERALVAIARAADGAMRDGQSIFDQIIAFCGGTGGDADNAITEADVIDVFGLASGRELTDLTIAIASNNVSGTMELIHDLAERGRDLERLFGDLVMFLRNAMVYHHCRQPEDILDVSEAELSDIQKLAAIADARLVERLLEGLAGEEGSLRNALNKRVFLEVALVQVMHHAHDIQIDRIIARLNELRGTELPGEKKNEVNTPPPGSAQYTANPSTEGPDPGDDHVAESGSREVKDQEEPADLQVHTDKLRYDAADDSKSGNENTAPIMPPQNPRDVDSRSGGGAREPVPASENTANQPHDPGSQGTESTSEDAEDPALLWHKLIEAVGQIPEKHQLKTYMQELRPLAYNKESLQVAYDDEFPEEHVQFLLQSNNLNVLEKALCRITGESAVSVLLKRWVEGVSNKNTKPRRTSSKEVRERVQGNPFVKKVQDMFNAELIDVRG